MVRAFFVFFWSFLLCKSGCANQLLSNQVNIATEMNKAIEVAVRIGLH